MVVEIQKKGQKQLMLDKRKGVDVTLTTENIEQVPCTRASSVTVPSEGFLIGKGWKVTADSLNIILSRRLVNQKTGQERWIAEFFFATLGGALNYLVEQGVRGTGLKELKLVCSRVEELKADIMAALARLN